jgi:hypothetical protein
MYLKTIIQEADVRVPNAFSNEQKTDWLNEVNNEFFDIVKIPKTNIINLTGATSIYNCADDVREKNVRKVVVGSTFYRSMIYENITDAFNNYTINETSHQIFFSPNPPAGTAIIVYDRISTLNFVSDNLMVSPEAPLEYHWIYVIGLCVRIAKAMSDVALANNYDNDYKGNLAIAQQNYLRG